MKLIIGLGNPGKEYAESRHNIGFTVVKNLAEEAGIRISKKDFSSLWGKGKLEGAEVLLLLPQTFMNRSGEAVRGTRDYYRISDSDLVVVHDDLDLPLGRVKVDFDAGAAGHRGVLSIIETLGTKAFHRVRMGIGRPERKEEVEGFVLSPFDREEEKGAEEMVRNAVGMIKKWTNV